MAMFIAVSLIVTVGFVYNGDGTGWLEIAFKRQGLTETKETTTEDIDVSDTVYSLDFIENNEYLFAVGATEPECVVAAFNMDFSEVYIIANGSDSDGIMKDLNETTSPMSQKADTVANAFVEEGVKKIGEFAFYGCSKLESITISNSVESISNNAFLSCPALETVYGVSGSYAEAFANENGYVFVAV